jgi:ubiquitin C-terminal hydrolase
VLGVMLQAPHADPPPVAVAVAVAAVATAVAVVLWQWRGTGGQLRAGGLRNWGESRCYYNSVLQAWAAARALHLSGETNDDGDSDACGPLQRSLREVASALNDAAPVPVASALADRVLREFRRAGGTVEGGQQDAHELLLRLVDALRRESLRRRAGQQGLAVALRGRPPMTLRPCFVRHSATSSLAAGWLARALADPPCWGLLSSSVVCLSCSASTVEMLVPFSCISVVLPLTTSVLTVKDCLAEHFRPDFLSGYTCANCTVQRRRSSGDACKLTLAPRLPRVLIMHFSRLPTLGYKNNARVKVDEFVDLAPFVRGRWDGGRDSAPPQPELYRLAAVIAHSGGAGSGHYVCFGRRGNTSGTEGDLDENGYDCWILASDERVVAVPFSAVQLASGVYMAVYEAVIGKASKTLLR